MYEFSYLLSCADYDGVPDALAGAGYAIGVYDYSVFLGNCVCG
jgi:hypothetical protein